jgi:hypothetical protein
MRRQVALDSIDPGIKIDIRKIKNRITIFMKAGGNPFLLSIHSLRREKRRKQRGFNQRKSGQRVDHTLNAFPRNLLCENCAIITTQPT